MKNIKVMRDNAKKLVEELNKAVWTEDALKIEDAKKAAKNGIEAVNKAILENDFEAFKEMGNPAEAMFIQCKHEFDRMKTSKIKGTERTLYEYVAEDDPKFINLATAIGYGVITSDYMEDLKELFDRYNGLYTDRIKASELADSNGKNKGRKANPYGDNAMLGILKNVFNKLGIVNASPIGKIIGWMEPFAVSPDKVVPNNMASSPSEVRDLAILRVAHTMLTGKPLMFNGKEI